MDSREVLKMRWRFRRHHHHVHDRYFINRIANRIIEMQPDGVTEYIGNYDDYIERKNRPVAVEAEAGKTKTELEKENGVKN